MVGSWGLDDGLEGKELGLVRPIINHVETVMSWDVYSVTAGGHELRAVDPYQNLALITANTIVLLAELVIPLVALLLILMKEVR